jgi:hypothetical protein
VEPALKYGAGGYFGRASDRDFDVRRMTLLKEMNDAFYRANPDGAKKTGTHFGALLRRGIVNMTAIAAANAALLPDRGGRPITDVF